MPDTQEQLKQLSDKFRDIKTLKMDTRFYKELQKWD